MKMMVAEGVEQVDAPRVAGDGLRMVPEFVVEVAQAGQAQRFPRRGRPVYPASSAAAGRRRGPARGGRAGAGPIGDTGGAPPGARCAGSGRGAGTSRACRKYTRMAAEEAEHSRRVLAHRPEGPGQHDTYVGSQVPAQGVEGGLVEFAGERGQGVTRAGSRRGRPRWRGASGSRAQRVTMCLTASGSADTRDAPMRRVSNSPASAAVSRSSVNDRASRPPGRAARLTRPVDGMERPTVMEHR